MYFCNLTFQSSDISTLIEKINENEVDLLIITPEKVFSRHFLQLLSADHIKPIGMVCIDEAHCLSEWSHSFRWSYLHVVRYLKEQLKVKCILCLTATASIKTQESICSMVGIQQKNVIRPKTFTNSNFTITLSQPKQ